MLVKLCIGLLTLLCSINSWALRPSDNAEWQIRAHQIISTELQPSTLTPQEQYQELAWFADAAQDYKDIQVRVVSERIDTHFYEANTLAKAFFELTGIHVVHEITGEDDVIKKMQAQISTGKSLYDAYINDSDLIGFHIRSNETLRLDTFMKNEGAKVTLPTLDLNDFIGLKFTTSPEGHLYQLPDQQFANLYWYRADWFARPDLQAQFNKIYGYDLAVPQNWQAYEDIAEFFTVHVKQLDGQRVWGHMDYGKRDPSLGWRISDAWLSLAGTGDKGLPNGTPVDDWGIRVEDCRPAGASVARGGALNSPAAIYAVEKYIEWLNKYAPPQAKTMNFTEAGNWLVKGNIAQQIWWYSAFTAALTKPGTAIVNSDGTPKWRMAPSPKGAYWEKGMKLGYQDAGPWTFLKNTPIKRIKAAWLYAQFLVSKSVSLKKTLVGLTPIRLSDINSAPFTNKAKKLGGLVEFYRSTGRDVWTPTGSNVPDYTKLSNLWWQFVGEAVAERATVRRAMYGMASAFDTVLENLSTQQTGPCAPKLNPKQTELYWLEKAGAPKPALSSFPPAATLPYKEAIRVWK
ncbi:ABC transporter substrate-binding protein [Oleiphilus sp. HI0086]|uniref:ABC transporter substrate-binding protein n=2 Tax=unclassified Oleiphilus TaxID=2631174 RepID=UPI0007C385B2|nr:ABC transporter substrate-binding protein [Oleiphilus sp. HI0086]KZZ36752.1 ABC transporter substrate-binding protein [Oleiphilus sp. HI0086]